MTTNTNADPPVGLAGTDSSTVETTLPMLFDIEGGAYVFVAVREDPTLDEHSNWLSQTLRVDLGVGAADELHVDLTERYHVDGGESHIAFEDRFTVNLGLEAETAPHSVAAVRCRLRRWYRRAYLESGSNDGPLEPELSRRTD